MQFDEAALGARKLEDSLRIDLGGHGLVGIRRDADGVYRGKFCLDARALCRSQRLAAIAGADGTHKVTVFDGRVVVETKDVPSVDLDALWNGSEVSLTSSTPVADTIDPARTLVITSDDVIKDPTRTYTPCGDDNAQHVPQPFGNPAGHWAFGRLMKLLAGKTDPNEFLKSWILQFDPPPTKPVNTFQISPRPDLRRHFVVPWCSATGTTGCDESDDDTIKLTPETAPFRLLAIVNRIDLAEVFLFGPPQSKSAGELRFIFSGHKWNACATALNLFVIVEYEVRKSTCDELTKWAKSWVDLGALTGAQYVDGLDALVESIVVAPPGRVRIRTSETGFGTNEPGTFPWMMRQFEWRNGDLQNPKVDSTLVATTVSRTPDVSFQVEPGLSHLRTWIASNGDAVDFDRHEIEDVLANGVRFAGGEGGMFAFDPPAPGTFWKIPGADTPQRPHLQHHFSLNTCPACHSGETHTNAVHVRSSGVFGSVHLSDFLKGGVVVDDPRGQVDCSGKVVKRSYGDLTRRKQVLACIANGFGTPCLCQAMLQRISTPH